MIDELCQRYSKLPSDILGIKDERVSIDFNLSIMMKAKNIIDEITKKRQMVDSPIGTMRTGIEGIHRMQQLERMRGN